MTDFDRCFEKTLRLEGGGEYVNDPDDAGGETRWGVSKRAFPDLDIKNLTKEQAKQIYRENYWNPTVGQEQFLTVALQWKFFDIAVNQGVSMARNFWNELLNVTAKNDISGRIFVVFSLNFLCEKQMKRYVDIVIARPANLKFLKGWTQRAFDKGEDL